MEKEYLTIREVADRLQLCVKTIYRMIADGRLKTVVVSGSKRKTRRILRGELDRMVSENWQ